MIVRKHAGARVMALAMLVLLGGTAATCPNPGPLEILLPADGQLSPVGDVEAKIRLPGNLLSYTMSLNGNDVTGLFTEAGGVATATLPGLAAGAHQLVVDGVTNVGPVSDASDFDVLAFDFSSACEWLNAEECLLPYPSDHFRAPDGLGGFKLALPQEGLPVQNPGQPVPSALFEVRDGFNPTTQVLMHFPQGVDLEASGAPRLHEIPNRSTDLTSLQSNSPTVLLRTQVTGDAVRVLHWTENDSQAEAGPERRVTFLRPGHALMPDTRYVVAVRSLVDEAGDPVEPEPVFRALRDGAPTGFPEIEVRRPHFEQIFADLAEAGVAREDLVLAFDFTTATDENVTGQMLSMRDQAFAWLATTFDVNDVSVDELEEFDCSDPDQNVWKELRGRYPVPLFLDGDPETAPIPASFLQLDPADDFTPVFTTTMNPEYGISIPCEAQSAPVSAMVIGHGLFGDGPSFAHEFGSSMAEASDELGLGAPAKITGGTHWRGMSSKDFQDPFQGSSFIVNSVVFNLDEFPTLPHRLMQGQLNQLVLARIMKQGLLNSHPAFQAPVAMGGHGVFEVNGDMPYFGISLGGIMGLMFGALSPDVERLNVDVPAINFSLLLPRATPFILFQTALDISIGPDPMTQSLGLSLIQEAWTTGEPSAYARHITSDPLPGTNAKQILMTQAWLDQQVSNQATEIAARTLGLPQLVGSLVPGLPSIADQPGPLPSAYVVYDTGALDPTDTTNAELIPPLTNAVAVPGCDPHAKRVTIPASFQQLAVFLQPGGMVENFCFGLCDADPSVLETGPVGDFQLEIPQDLGSCPKPPNP